MKELHIELENFKSDIETFQRLSSVASLEVILQAIEQIRDSANTILKQAGKN